MSDVYNWDGEKSFVHVVSTVKDVESVANELYEKSLWDAKKQLHPLLHTMEPDALEQRSEFRRAFKSALEQRIARKLAAWQPGIQAIFRFDETWKEKEEAWDSSIHLLAKVPRLSNTLKALGKTLDQSLVKALKQSGWSRFQKRQSILDVQQVTPSELRHGVSYGAMFYAVYTVPSRVWPQNRRAK